MGEDRKGRALDGRHEGREGAKFDGWEQVRGDIVVSRIYLCGWVVEWIKVASGHPFNKTRRHFSFCQPPSHHQRAWSIYSGVAHH